MAIMDFPFFPPKIDIFSVFKKEGAEGNCGCVHAETEERGGGLFRSNRAPKSHLSDGRMDG